MQSFGRAIPSQDISVGHDTTVELLLKLDTHSGRRAGRQTKRGGVEEPKYALRELTEKRQSLAQVGEHCVVFGLCGTRCRRRWPEYSV